jgi:hypothetical protein
MYSTDNPAPRSLSFPLAPPSTQGQVELRAGAPALALAPLTSSAPVADEALDPWAPEGEVYVGFSDDMWG